MIESIWKPIQPTDLDSEQYDFGEIRSLHQQWQSIKHESEASTPNAYKSFMEKLGRSWAIETGILEGLYTLDRGVTETLVANGIVADYIERSSTNKEPQQLVEILKDHQDSIEFVYQAITNERPLSQLFIRELHIILTKNQDSFPAVDQFGVVFDTVLDKGGFKKLPNNPTRPDGSIREYCPPLQVESELDNLLYLYQEYERNRSEYHPLLAGAWLHHRFTQIHPFQDDNGRVARALLTWHLVKEEFLPIVITRDDRDQYIEALESADSGILTPFVDRGGPGEKEHWYRMEVIGTAKKAQHWVNLNEARFFIKVSLAPEMTRHPRLVFVTSLHHTGSRLTGIMAATAFALIEHYSDDITAESMVPGNPYFRDCTVNPFTFTWEDDVETVKPRLVKWSEECLSIALSYWGEFLA